MNQAPVAHPANRVTSTTHMPDGLNRLAAALSDRYRIERELRAKVRP